MKNQIGLIILTLVIGIGIGYSISPEKESKSLNVHQMPDGTMMSNSMGDMLAGLDGKKGDDFDKAFLSEMIIHHEGAVEMARLALVNAKHEEIKSMANSIILTQTNEIIQMKQWLNNWYSK